MVGGSYTYTHSDHKPGKFMRSLAVLTIAAIGLSACATNTPQPSSEDLVYDPFEPLNRKIYGFNEGVDNIFLGPVARGYNRAVPEPARDGVTNALRNLNSPVVFVNDVLQAKPQRAAETLSRFVINSTVGLGGLIDVADKSGLEGHSEDFGQTLGYWGVPMGAYVMSPFLGPSNIRDTTGRIVDIVFDPLFWIEYNASDMLDTYIQSGRTLGTSIDTRARFDESIETLRRQPEPYTALRRAYASGRKTAIRDGKPVENPYDDLPDFDEFDDFEDLEDE